MKINLNRKYNREAIRLEPSDWYDDAIVGVSKDGFLIYSYFRLIQVQMKKMNEPEEDSQDWIDTECLCLTSDHSPQFKVSYARKYIWKKHIKK